MHVSVLAHERWDSRSRCTLGRRAESYWCWVLLSCLQNMCLSKSTRSWNISHSKLACWASWPVFTELTQPIRCPYTSCESLMSCFLCIKVKLWGVVRIRAVVPSQPLCLDHIVSCSLTCGSLGDRCGPPTFRKKGTPALGLQVRRLRVLASSLGHVCHSMFTSYMLWKYVPLQVYMMNMLASVHENYPIHQRVCVCANWLRCGKIIVCFPIFYPICVFSMFEW